jgi:hypothetical protein
LSKWQRAGNAVPSPSSDAQVNKKWWLTRWPNQPRATSFQVPRTRCYPPLMITRNRQKENLSENIRATISENRGGNKKRDIKRGWTNLQHRSCYTDIHHKSSDTNFPRQFYLNHT